MQAIHETLGKLHMSLLDTTFGRRLTVCKVHVRERSKVIFTLKYAWSVSHVTSILCLIDWEKCETWNRIKASIRHKYIHMAPHWNQEEHMIQSSAIC